MIRDEIITMMGRTLFVCAYADAHNRDELPDHLPGASMGADWMDVSPETPVTAREAGEKLAAAYEELNGKPVEALYEIAINLPGRHTREATPRDFGFCLAMEALGHGVGWGDDHPDHDFTVPWHVESSVWWEREAIIEPLRFECSVATRSFSHEQYRNHAD